MNANIGLSIAKRKKKPLVAGVDNGGDYMGEAVDI